eukprot:8044495-Pyramimonas_sp.AAC.1
MPAAAHTETTMCALRWLRLDLHSLARAPTAESVALSAVRVTNQITVRTCPRSFVERLPRVHDWTTTSILGVTPTLDGVDRWTKALSILR